MHFSPLHSKEKKEKKPSYFASNGGELSSRNSEINLFFFSINFILIIAQKCIVLMSLKVNLEVQSHQVQSTCMYIIIHVCWPGPKKASKNVLLLHLSTFCASFCLFYNLVLHFILLITCILAKPILYIKTALLQRLYDMCTYQ